MTPKVAAKLYERPPFVGQAILPADSLSAGPSARGADWSFDAVWPKTTAADPQPSPTLPEAR